MNELCEFEGSFANQSMIRWEVDLNLSGTSLTTVVPSAFIEWCRASSPSAAWADIERWWTRGRVNSEEQSDANQLVDSLDHIVEDTPTDTESSDFIGPLWDASRQQRGVRMSRAAIYGQSARMTINCLTRTRSAEQAVKAHILRELREANVRKVDIHELLYDAIEAAFIPSRYETRAARYRSASVIINRIDDFEESTYSLEPRRWFHLFRKRRSAKPISQI